MSDLFLPIEYLRVYNVCVSVCFCFRNVRVASTTTINTATDGSATVVAWCEVNNSRQQQCVVVVVNDLASAMS